MNSADDYVAAFTDYDEEDCLSGLDILDPQLDDAFEALRAATEHHAALAAERAALIARLIQIRAEKAGK